MGKLMAIIFGVGLVIGIMLGFWWLAWKLWLYVIPMMWANGPENFIRPNYWLFVGMWVLLALLGNMFKSSSK